MAIRIRAEQLKRLESSMLETYLSELTTHVEKKYPHVACRFDGPRLRRVLHEGFLRAGRSGFSRRGPVRSYVEMMIVFGAGFETDPQYPWIGASLEKGASLDQRNRFQQLFLAACDYLEKTDGKNREHRTEAAARFERFDANGLAVDSLQLETQLPRFARQNYPGKTQRVETDGWKRLIASGVRKAQQIGYTQSKDWALVVLLMFLYGHEFDSDPFLAIRLPDAGGYDAATNTYRASNITRQLEAQIRLWGAEKKMDDKRIADDGKQ